jgi:hypothetical protein
MNKLELFNLSLENSWENICIALNHLFDNYYNELPILEENERKKLINQVEFYGKFLLDKENLPNYYTIDLLKHTSLISHYILKEYFKPETELSRQKRANKKAKLIFNSLKLEGISIKSNKKFSKKINKEFKYKTYED